MISENNWSKFSMNKSTPPHRLIHGKATPLDSPKPKQNILINSTMQYVTIRDIFNCITPERMYYKITLIIHHSLFNQKRLLKDKIKTNLSRLIYIHYKYLTQSNHIHNFSPHYYDTREVRHRLFCSKSCTTD